MIRLTKSANAPASLASQQSYTGKDVIDQLHADFYNKCYLCEESEPTKIEIDHFEPHYKRAKLHLVFNWDNLFFSCGHCNGTKSNTWPIHSCLNNAINILSAVRYHRFVDANMTWRIEVIPTANNAIDLNTAEVLNKIFGGRTPIRGLESTNLVSKINKRCHQFFEKISLYKSTSSPVIKSACKLSIQNELKPQTEFISILAWHIVDNGLSNDFSNELQALGY